MRILNKSFFYGSLILIGLTTSTISSFAAVSLPWTTTYNCSEWSQTGFDPICDGLQKALDGTTIKGSKEQITSSANFSGGNGGRGQRHWTGAGNGGVNDTSGGTSVTFPKGQDQVWIRWYMRFEPGFYWQAYEGYKALYLKEGDWTVNNYFMNAFYGGRIDYYTQYGDQKHYSPSDYFGWEQLHGGSVSDGSWHCYEIYIKSESGPGLSNGIFRAWVDGQLKINATSVNHGLASRGKLLTGFYIGSNAKLFPQGEPDRYTDYDDFYVTNIQPTNQDANGNPMIGPIALLPPTSEDIVNQKPVASFSATPVKGTAPLTVSFANTSTGEPTSWEWDFDNNGTVDSNENSPTHIYSTSGSYTVNMTATNVYGSDTVVTSNYITVEDLQGIEPPTSIPAPKTLLTEDFENSDFSSRGWYDFTSPALSTTEKLQGSSASVEYHFLQGATSAVSGGAMRKKFTETDSVYLKFHIKYSANWVGSNVNYHPHQFYFLTNKNGDWDNLAFTHLTTYVEANNGYPLIGIQDGANINQTKVGQDLTQSTEIRSVAGGNGDSDRYAGSYYLANSGQYWNWKQWKVQNQLFSDSNGPYYKNDWHKVEAYIKLNSIINNKAVNDGVIQYWFDDQLIMEYTDVVLRTGQHPDMKFNQIIIGPWIGDGSPVDQTFWVDSLSVATDPPYGQPAPPSGLRIIQ